eukprot:TRINITY_DN10166_c0_g1_i5.p1 TRINITY_DN10166_c0_g1~~TRINITY_DN10166_c0_g1_i5.p1  ORF type:complete len:309 (-),score=32.20 TRINITY_DN10166_c0_g1_i5:67-993(-)
MNPSLLAKTLVTNSKLRVLEMDHMKCPRSGSLISFSESLKKNTSLQTLKIMWGHFGQQDFDSLSTALNSNTSLNELSLAGNQMTSFGTGLQINSTLTSLNISANLIKDVRFLHSFTSLKKLYIGHNNLGDDQTKMIAEYLKNNTILVTLSMRGNDISSPGMVALAESLKVNTTLSFMDLKKNSISRVKELSECLAINTSLTILNLGNNHITRKGSLNILSALQNNKTITSLLIQGGGVPEFVCTRIATICNYNFNRKRLIQELRPYFMVITEGILSKDSPLSMLVHDVITMIVLFWWKLFSERNFRLF